MYMGNDIFQTMDFFLFIFAVYLNRSNLLYIRWWNYD